MAYNVKPPVLATPAAREMCSAWQLNDFQNSQILTSSQALAAALVARRYGLLPHMARLVVEFSGIGGRS